MNHLEVSTGTGSTSDSVNAATFSAVQDKSNFSNNVSDSSNPRKQANIFPTSASASIASSGDAGGGQRSMEKPYHLQLQPIPPICAFPKEYQTLAHDSKSYPEFKGGNYGLMNDNKDVSIGLDKKFDSKGNLFKSAHNDSTPDIAGMKQNQSTPSEASFGSFSVNEESVSDGNFRDLTADNDMAHQKALEGNPQIGVSSNGEKMSEYQGKNLEDNQIEQKQHQYALLMEHENSHLPSTIGNARKEHSTEENEKKNNNIRDDNLVQFQRSGADLPVLGINQNNQKAGETRFETQVNENTGAATMGAHSQQPHKVNEQQKTKVLADDVIELLDDDTETVVQQSQQPRMATGAIVTSGVKRSRPTEINANHNTKPIVPGSTLQGYQSHSNQYVHSNNQRVQPSGLQTAANANMIRRRDVSSEPQYISLPADHIPTWEHPLPPLVRPSQAYTNGYKHFELSLLNVSEFTITGLPVTLDGRPSSVLGFRKIVKEVSRGHGKAIFERDNPKQNTDNLTNSSSSFNAGQYSSHGEDANPDGGKWRIPLGAYRAFYSYLQSDNMCKVKGIPEDQLKIASLGKARLEKGFPSARKIISFGVPNGLATALAPFQRGGVEFVVEREGRALIADDMGLGKTIQSIASMSVYHDEWPLLILTPSSARYHWAAEFNNWLGSGSSVNNKQNSSCTADQSDNEGEPRNSYDVEDTNTTEPRKSMRLLKESEIHVMVAGREKIFPSTETRIVIISYGLATSLVESGKLSMGLFRCAIVDESHMLKNIKTKRTSKLVPILHATNRCILLSGTPALARPTELWPQLKILSTERDGWWDDEDNFVRKYVQRTSAIRRAELHTMLTGTVMIRRMKHDMLKSLPSKQREKAIVDVVTPEMRREFHDCMKLLREGKGVMAKIAKRHPALIGKSKEEKINPTEEKKLKLESLKAEYNERCRQKSHSIRFAMQSIQMNYEEKENLMAKYFHEAKSEVDIWYNERINELQNKHPEKANDQELDRKTILNKMYSMTAKAKIPLIAELVGKWLDDPTKGKLCIFAHHIHVLDEIVKLVGLSNTQGSRKRFIRIDGSCSPKDRQAQIVAFQNDPNLRIAVLGITAAGVAVTLTASSTVWFAELFWTPALMIQAEDRCHRIGQNAAVKCLYFVATGTLDVLLWDLLEKKFQDLGEFVEGKEKMKIVVQKTFKSVEELQSIFIRPDDNDFDEDVRHTEIDPAAEGDDLIKLESDLQDDIVQLAHEEMVMISQGDDEDGIESKIKGKHGSEVNSAQAKSGLGQTEDEAICLSDDEEDSPTHCDKSTKAESKGNSPAEGSGSDNNFDFRKTRVLHKCRFYKQYFEGSTYGMQLLYVYHRLAVANNRFGKVKPALGDVLVAVNGHRLPLGCPLDHACRYMKQLIRKNTVELTFVEDESFVRQFLPAILETRKTFEASKNQNTNKKPRNAPSTKSEDVIEILDDD